MTSQTITHKIKDLEGRLVKLERMVLRSPTLARKQVPLQPAQALELLAGLWTKKPRTRRDLKLIRRRLWRP